MNFYTISSNDLYLESAKKFLAVIDGYLSRKQSVLLFLSGGSAVRLYPYLMEWIKEHPNRSFQGKLTLGTVDERFRPKFQMQNIHNSDINAEAIAQTGLWNVCSEKGVSCQVIPQTGTMEESSAEYNQTISSLWKTASKKIAVLGIGEDGHTAGLLPGYRKEWDVDRMVVGYKNDGSFPQRISLTPKALKSLDSVLVVLSGARKRPILKQMQSLKRADLSGKGQSVSDLDRFPAGILCTIKNVDILTDQKKENQN